MSRISATLVALLLSGCVAAGVKISQDQIQQLKVGETTYDQAVSILGQPTSSSATSSGYRSVSYTYVEVTSRPENFIPIVGPLVGGHDSKTGIVMLNFGPDGKLKNWTTSGSAMGTGKNISSGNTSGRVPQQPSN